MAAGCARRCFSSSGGGCPLAEQGSNAKVSSMMSPYPLLLPHTASGWRQQRPLYKACHFQCVLNKSLFVSWQQSWRLTIITFFLNLFIEPTLSHVRDALNWLCCSHELRTSGQLFCKCVYSVSCRSQKYAGRKAIVDCLLPFRGLRGWVKQTEIDRFLSPTCVGQASRTIAHHGGL